MLNISKVDLAYGYIMGQQLKVLGTRSGLSTNVTHVYIYMYIYMYIYTLVFLCVCVCSKHEEHPCALDPWILTWSTYMTKWAQLRGSVVFEWAPDKGGTFRWVDPLDHETQDFRIRYTTKYNTMSRHNGLMIPICLKEEANRPIWSVVDVLRIFLQVSSTS